MLLYFRLLKKHWIVWTDWSQWKRIGEQLHYFNAKWVHQYDTWCVQIVKFPFVPGFTLSLSSRNSSLASSTRKQLKWSTRWISNQAMSVLLLCLNICTIHTLATLVGESNVSRTTSKPEAHCSHYQQVTFFTAIGIKCSQLYSCKYQRLLITFINFNQSVSRLTIMILMTALPKEVSVKTGHVFNQP